MEGLLGLIANLVEALGLLIESIGAGSDRSDRNDPRMSKRPPEKYVSR